MNVGGDLSGNNQHLIPQTEIESNNAALSDVTSLCGEHFDHVGTYNVRSWASFRGMERMEEYLEEKAETLCPECLNIATRHHGWPETASVLKAVVDA